MKYFFMLFAFIAGATIPLQSTVNSRMAQQLGQPFHGTLISFAGGLLIILLVCIFSPIGLPSPARLSGINWIYFTGGLYGIFVVTSVLLSVPVAGVANTIAAGLAGQLIMSVLFDHFGWMGVTELKISISRVAGILLLIGGVYLVQR